MLSAHSHKRRVGLSREEGPGARSCSMGIELWQDVVNEGFKMGRSKETGQEILPILEEPHDGSGFHGKPLKSGGKG